MSYTKEIVCLANSRRPGGHCVAGKEAKNGRFGEWIRPVASEDSDGLTDSDICCDDKRLPRVLDILRIWMKKHIREGHQTENYRIDGEMCWQRVGRFPFSGVSDLVDRVDKLWINGFESDYGINDRVPCARMGAIENSLLLIQPSQLAIHKEYEFGSRKWKTRADFTFRQIRYCLVITDPQIETMYRQQPAGDYPFRTNDVYLTISLGESFNGFCYKLVAGVIFPGML